MGLAKLTPFKKDRQSFPGVVIQLAHAPAHKPAKGDEKDNKSLDRASSSENGSAPSLGETSHLTLEALRAEVEADISTSGQDSAYDRKWQSLFPHSAYLAFPPERGPKFIGQ